MIPAEATLLSVRDVWCSEYAGLWTFFLGESVRIFGREGAPARPRPARPGRR